MKLKSPWSTEVEFCRDFMAAARRAGHRVFPEFQGVDMYLVRADTGVRVAIEAKMHPNLDVLAQAMGATGADYTCVLVPHTNGSFNTVAFACGVVVLRMGPQFAWEQASPELLADRCVQMLPGGEIRQSPHKRVVRKYPELPPAEPLEMDAGAPAPRRLTKWKLAACQLCLKALNNDGLFTKDDFKAAGVDMGRWHKLDWIERVSMERRDGKTVTTYRLLDKPGAPHVLYPEVMNMLRSAADTCTKSV